MSGGKNNIWLKHKLAFTLRKFYSLVRSVHIRDKKTVAQRLVLSSLNVVYGQKDLRYRGPMVSAFYIDIGYYTRRLEFDSAKEPISVQSKDGFEVRLI